MNRLENLSAQLQDNAYVRVERRGTVGLIRLLRAAPPRSQVGGCVLSGPMRAQILRALRTLETDDRCFVIVLSSTSERFFSSGFNRTNVAEAFISDLTQQPPVPSLAMLTDAIEACPKVCIAAIEGLCASWGLELALAADYRVCAINAKFRFPEVHFGITPCGGGVRRLVCRVGVPHALHMLCYGQPVYAQEAQQMGLVDAPASEVQDLWSELQRFIPQQVAVSSKKAIDSMEAAKAAKEKARKHSRSCPAYARLPLLHRGCYAWMEHKLRELVPRARVGPYNCIEAVKLAVTHSLAHQARERADVEGSADSTPGDAAYTAAEQQLFESCLALPEAQASQHLLRASQHTSRAWIRRFPDAAPAAVEMEGTETAFRKVAVMGAGTVGTSIALMLLWLGELDQVILIDADADRQKLAVQAIEAHLRSRVGAHRLSSHKCEAMLSRLRAVGSTLTPYPPQLAEADLVLECAPEVVALKQNILTHLDLLCKPSTIFATVSSAQDIDALAAVTGRPGQVIGMHFFPPANHCPVAEVICGAATQRWVVGAVVRLFDCLDKYAVVSGGHQGYVGTRLLLAALYQAYTMLEDGCFPLQIDLALRKTFHFRRGLFELEDVMGLDSTASARACFLQNMRTHSANGNVVRPPATKPSTGEAASNNIKAIVQQPPSAEEVGNQWWLPSRAVFDIPNSMIVAGALGRKTREGWYTYATRRECTLGHALRHPISSWLWLPSSGAAFNTAPPASLYTAEKAAALRLPVSMVSSTSSPTTAATLEVASTDRYRVPLVSLDALVPQHNYAGEYRALDSSKRHHCTRRPFRDTEIVERVVLSMVNEAAKMLADGVIVNSADVDCISVYAFGFPAWKGGLCYYADHVEGIEKVVYRMKVYHRALGSEEFPFPCTALQEMSAKRQTFESISK